jgi:hypothetical protein
VAAAAKPGLLVAGLTDGTHAHGDGIEVEVGIGVGVGVGMSWNGENVRSGCCCYPSLSASLDI